MRAARNRVFVGLVALLALAVTVVSTSEATGAGHRRATALDPTFGRHGRVLAVPPRETEPTVFAAAARQPNGEILLDLHRGTIAHGKVRELELRRPNGEPDPSFGKRGRVPLSSGKGLLALGNGDVLVGVDECGGKLSSVLMLGPDGAPVPSFGRDGCGAYVGISAERLAVDPAGNILVGGSTSYCDPCSKNSVPTSEVVVARLLPDGSIDRSFGGSGSVSSRVDLGLKSLGFFQQLSPNGFAATADGGIVISTGESAFRIAPSGALDTAFGSGGVVTAPDHDAGPVLVQPDGSLDLVTVDTPKGTLSVTKLGPHGNLETGYGNGGTAQVTTPAGPQQYQLVAATAPEARSWSAPRIPSPAPARSPAPRPASSSA